ncbi:MAG TPA: M13 family metallopeptidase [Caulobacteraceae bacterium]|nr:M13 family metallopeptidase [Caulobacteraceae bacterium]
MKLHSGAAATLGAIVALNAPPLVRADPATAVGSSAASAPAPQFGKWGFDLSGRDTSIAPGADFYGYANGDYVKALVIPPDRSRYGSFDYLAALSEDRVHRILETALTDTSGLGDEAKIGAFYHAFMDETRVDALGAAPIAPELAKIRAAKDRRDIARLMGLSNGGFYSAFFGVGIGSDFKDPDHYAIYLGQDGLGLPDRDYYLDASFAAQKAEYQAYVARMLTLAGWPDAAAEAKAVVDLETQIATVSWPIAEQRDPVKNYNPTTPADLATDAPGFDWDVFFDAAGLGAPARVIVAEKSAFPKIAQIFQATPLETLKAWEAFRVADAAAPYLSEPFVNAHFEFRAKDLSGQQAQRPRWKRAVAVVDEGMGEAVGRAYVAAYFPAASKAKMEALVANIRAALANRIQHVTWMSDATKAKAIEKLSKLTVKIGYPNKWRDYGALSISPDDLVGDVERADAFEWRRQVKRLHGPVDRSEWGMSPQTVNAYYNPTANEIVFPAAILQPPFFNPNADMAVNYGGIGAVIGHEMTHGFDDEGRQFDGDGRLADWWQPEDKAKFVAQTKVLGAQFSAMEPLPGVHIKGDQTMGENIADLGGLLLALDAYHASLGGKPAPVIDGLTGDQRLFLGFAQIWRSAERPDALKEQIVSDVHSPSPDRVDGVVRNVDAWYAAWGVKPGDPLYVAPADRVRIW